MKIGVILNTHQNSMVFKDTLESILTYLGDQVLVLVDGISWDQFENDKEKIPVMFLKGLNHGVSSSPYRNMALGLMKGWEVWKDQVDWYCYLEYDCLIGSSAVKEHLKIAQDSGLWMVGNDFREYDKQINFVNNLAGKEINLKYLLGCCLFFNLKFMKKLNEDKVLKTILDFSNLHGNSPFFFSGQEKTIWNQVYDISEFLYPTLATCYGGKVGEFACWKEKTKEWTGAFNEYTMRFRPDLNLTDPVFNSCIMHPLKDFTNPVRTYHRGKRKFPFQ